MGELKELSGIQDGNISKFIKLVDVVERAWLDLSKMGMQSEMDTSMMINHVEKPLPPIQRREWAIFRQKLSEKTSFNTLLHFLLQEKKGNCIHE